MTATMITPAVSVPDGWTAVASRGRTGEWRITLTDQRRLRGYIAFGRANGLEFWTLRSWISVGSSHPTYMGSWPTAQEAADAQTEMWG